jgi:hypothetical protein
MARNQTNNRTQKREAVPPTLIAYHVANRGDKGFWTRIGAAWDHKDGGGYTLQLDPLPADGGRIVLRPPRDNDEAEDGQDDGEAATEEADEVAAKK